MTLGGIWSKTKVFTNFCAVIQQKTLGQENQICVTEISLRLHLGLAVYLGPHIIQLIIHNCVVHLMYSDLDSQCLHEEPNSVSDLTLIYF